MGPGKQSNSQPFMPDNLVVVLDVASFFRVILGRLSLEKHDPGCTRLRQSADDATPRRRRKSSPWAELK